MLAASSTDLPKIFERRRDQPDIRGSSFSALQGGFRGSSFERDKKVASTKLGQRLNSSGKA